MDTLVVGAAIVRRGAVLAARRAHPTELAGRWELPGGKVEPGEDPAAALVRELDEELGCRVVVTRWLPREVRIRPGLVLRVAFARIRDDAEPAAREHAELRWVGVADLEGLDWLDADRPFLPDLRAELALARPRGVLHERDDAEAVAAQLRREGYEAWTERERLAGEDDDEDHPWAVLTDAPGVRLELLVEERDGWYDDGDPGPAPTPLDLPSGPRR